MLRTRCTLLPCEIMNRCTCCLQLQQCYCCCRRSCASTRLASLSEQSHLHQLSYFAVIIHTLSCLASLWTIPAVGVCEVLSEPPVREIGTL